VQGALSGCQAAPLARDGNLGPETSLALSRFQAENGLPRTGLADPVTVQHLHGAVTGGDAPRVAIVGDARGAEAAYAAAGFHPLTPPRGDGGDLATLLREHPVAVLHIRAPVTDHHGTPAVDLPTRLTGIALDRLIPRDLPTPLVVLDVPAPQLLLRNAFAAELSAVGTVRAILATSRMATLAAALREDSDIYDVTRAIRAHDEPQAALFARTPSVRFPMPR
jgi:peptidoglycan hydrolase-like protein with peptidoglycan-binding domain